uniref:Translational initiation factor 1 n=1 Tax=Phelipanche purpurea TaxID=223125 RepID=V6AQH0_PHEPU|nr:translational initiation factor 1 [Phelipanche purpurea]CDH98340.1 translational initiation factor 1 [Phelipanche purpurea]
MKEEKEIYEGSIINPLSNDMFRVKLNSEDRIIIGHISGNMRRKSILIMRGDKVLIEVSNYNPNRGRIFSRLPNKKKKDSKD